MKNSFYSKEIYTNLYERPSSQSKVCTQMIYGEKFKILIKKKKWLKIRTSFDNYIGYIKYINYSKKHNFTHKVNVLKTKILKSPNNSSKNKSKKFLPFASRVEILKKYKNFIMFEKNKWIKFKHIKKGNYLEKNFFKILKMFINCKYKWGGKTYDGIDCSALVQIFFQFNNKFVPRDTKDQVKFFNKKKNLIKKYLIFWRGHVAVCINKNSLIHAYGPKKKVVVMNIKKTINEIRQNAKLEVIK